MQGRRNKARIHDIALPSKCLISHLLAHIGSAHNQILLGVVGERAGH